MNRVRQSFFCLALVMVALAAQAQPTAPVRPKISSSFDTNLLPPKVQSPVSFFRQLLLMSPAERNQSLTNRPPESRARIMAKIREYLALDPDERELRLRATELRWYLTPLMHTAPANRDPQLAAVPPELRPLVKSRLAYWDALPPSFQQEFLTNDIARNLLAQTPDASATNSQSQMIADQISQFFTLTPREKKQILGVLSEAERTQMEKTFQSFNHLPPQQRAICLRNYAKFASMSDAERAEFLKNAESWSKLSAQERKSWRDLVERVPLWPPVPMPPPIVPHPPHPPHPQPKTTNASMATN
jgi:hypothetical protein